MFQAFDERAYMDLENELFAFLRQLRYEQGPEPAAGFYGRVVDRIAKEKRSIWTPLLYSRVSGRAILLSLLLAAAAMVSISISENDAALLKELAEHRRVFLYPSKVQEQRNAVLVEFAFYSR